MTRDEALTLMRRVMDRIERDGAVHLDACADEILAGWMLIEGMRPAVAQQPAQSPPLVPTKLSDDEIKRRLKLLGEMNAANAAGDVKARVRRMFAAPHRPLSNAQEAIMKYFGVDPAIGPDHSAIFSISMKQWDEIMKVAPLRKDDNPLMKGATPNAMFNGIPVIKKSNMGKLHGKHANMIVVDDVVIHEGDVIAHEGTEKATLEQKQKRLEWQLWVDACATRKP